jgi:transcriptional regulator with XRE-family HTH domain
MGTDTRHDDWRPPYRGVREANGWGGRQTARRARTDASYYHRIEAGTATPSLATFFRLAKALGLEEIVRLLKPFIRPEDRD